MHNSTRGQVVCGLALLLAVTLLPAASADEPGAKSKSVSKPTSAKESTSTKGTDAPLSGIAREVQALLDEGFQPGASHLPVAERKFATARRDFPDDPRLDFAFGLVLLKHQQPKLARAQFDSAVRRPGPGYWPAWQILIRMEIVDKEYDAAFRLIDEFSDRLCREAGSRSVTNADYDAARWLGCTLGTLELLADVVNARPQVTSSLELFRTLFGGRLLAEFESGRESIQVRYDQLIDDTEAKAESVARKKDKERQAETTKVQTTLDAAVKDKEANTRTGIELAKWAEDQLKLLDKQLNELERDYKFLDSQAQSISKSALLLAKEITAIEAQLALTNGAPGGNNPGSAPSRAVVVRSNFDQLLGQRKSQMLKYELEYADTQQRMADVTNQAQGVLRQRNVVVQQYELGSGKLLKKSAALDKWSVRLTEKKKKLAVSGTGKVKKVGTDSKARSFAAYVPLDLESERMRLMRSLRADL